MHSMETARTSQKLIAAIVAFSLTLAIVDAVLRTLAIPRPSAPFPPWSQAAMPSADYGRRGPRRRSGLAGDGGARGHSRGLPKKTARAICRSGLALVEAWSDAALSFSAMD